MYANLTSPPVRDLNFARADRSRTLDADKHFHRLNKGMIQMDILSMMGLTALIIILPLTASSANAMGIFLNMTLNFSNI
jgi:hypothetical protein